MEVCKGILKIMKEKRIPTPTVYNFKNVAQSFYENGNVPYCIKSIGSKHIRINCPNKSGNMFLNYRKFFFYCLDSCY